MPILDTHYKVVSSSTQNGNTAGVDFGWGSRKAFPMELIVEAKLDVTRGSNK